MIKNSHAGGQNATYDNDFFTRTYAPWLETRPDLREPATQLLAAILDAAETRAGLMARYRCEMPETLVVSLTSVCNKRCQFCGAADVIDGPKHRLPWTLLKQALSECAEIGIRRVALIGGEPTLYPDLIELLQGYPTFFFSIYTNGARLDPAALARLERLANHILIVNASATDAAGTIERLETDVMAVFERLRDHQLLFGYAATVHRDNYALFSRPETFAQLHVHGPRLGVLFDYLPEYDNEADRLAVDAGARAELVQRARSLAAGQAMMFMCTPEDEEIMGGCGAAGRSFIHLGPDGSLSPCPFVPYSQATFPQQSLLASVRGAYFTELRARSHAWEDLSGPCAYRAAERELASISARHGATRYAQRHASTRPTKRLWPLRRSDQVR